MTPKAMVISGLLGAAVGGLWLHRMRHTNPYRPVLERVEIPVPSGSPGLAGLRIGFISDIHAGPFIGEQDLVRAADLLCGHDPDLILLGGDYVSESPRHLAGIMPAIGDLCRSAPLGGYAVLGNHDIFVSEHAVVSSLAGQGIRVLRNEAVQIPTDGGILWLVGIDETLHGCPQPDQAFSSVPEGAPALVLWHEPEFAGQSAERRAFAQLSGHTHGGQMRLPGLRPAWLPRHGKKHVIGMSFVNGMPVYTSRGLGVYRPPLRLNCPPEVTLVALV
jgi:predicted MPP superfamily phosphohydrolase